MGDAPAGFEVRFHHGMVQVVDDQLGTEQRARNHRVRVEKVWSAGSCEKDLPMEDYRLRQTGKQVAGTSHHDQQHVKTLLRALLSILAEVAPIPAVIWMFSKAVIGIHHAFQVHRLAHRKSGSRAARQLIREVNAGIDHLDSGTAATLLELLVQEYGR